ncbi:jacalin-like lectin [Paenibacillus sp. FSL W8-1187]|uniref:Putative EXPORTED PROTEIN n=1 Tax=Paenibacillus pasadenensis TaxID=217090 RepID=A0A2N5N4X6_9BACL|nr:jacalin-like lectin [Paenibacillus pasadenensis]PLT45397.1 putative EXPORTED PROTEIN [Paenibacillus pasadenensis]
MPKWRKVLALTLALASAAPLGMTGYVQKASAATGSFTVLSYNIGGLPALLSSSSDPQKFTPLIGAKLGPYDLVNVQEDFNYHASLYANDNHPHRTPTSGGAGIGSGLNTLSNYPLNDLKRVTWNKRYGLFDNGSDELTPKGFTYSQIQMSAGVYIDVYNLHADANTDTLSNEARRDNLSQLATYIEAHSQGHAVLVFGDTNTRYTRSEDNLKSLFVDRLGMKDAWIEKVRGGSYPTMGADALLGVPGSTSADNEVVDKIFYRSGAALSLEANSYQVEDTYFTDENGAQLSDHYGIAANFTYSTSAAVSYSDLAGGSGGNGFNFLHSNAPATSAPLSVTLRGASRLDSIAMTYVNGTTISIGGSGGTTSTLTLDSGETIASALVYTNTYNNSVRIFYLELTTSKGRKIASGTKSGTATTFTAPAGSSIAGFFGRAADNIDKLGVIYKRL